MAGPPAFNTRGSVDGLPSASISQPGGTCSPRAVATLILPAAAADVAMSNTRGPSRLDGIAKAMGLVPRRALAPPNGATALALRPESAVIIAIMPSDAASSG